MIRQRFMGIDLTDSYARAPRPADVAIVEPSGRCLFASLPAFRIGHHQVSSWLGPLATRPGAGDRLIIDGPLALASLGHRSRACERELRAPGKTPDRLPAPRAFPYSGFVRGSVELAQALVQSGWAPASDTTTLLQATLLEAFPGDIWTKLAGARLPDKRRPEGFAARVRLLERSGLRFSLAPSTHDQLDAALCAWMGWTLHRSPARVRAAGRPCERVARELREGLIITL